MELIKAPEAEELEATVSLNQVKNGEVFRFAFLSFTNAIKEDAFYIKIQAPSEKGISIINLKDGTQLKRDSDHRVVIHHTTLAITE